MAISLKDLKKVRSTDPPRTLLYGPPGLGKTTLASEWPNPVFLQVEDGTPADLELNSFGVLNSYNEVMEAIGALYSEEHDFQTVVLDSLDKLEPKLWAAMCETNGWKSIEDPGYGKGYVASEEYWRDLLEGLRALRRDKNMAYVLIAHSGIIQFNDPRTTSYSRFDIRLHKKAQELVSDEVDLICFLNQEATIKEEAQGFNKKRVHAEGGMQRLIYVENRPSLNAKNRYGMPSRFPYKRGEGYAKLADYFPGGTKYGMQDNAPAEQPAADAGKKSTTNGRKAA